MRELFNLSEIITGVCNVERKALLVVAWNWRFFSGSFSTTLFFFVKILKKSSTSAGAMGVSQLAFFINLQRAFIGPSATLTGR